MKTLMVIMVLLIASNYAKTPDFKKCYDNAMSTHEQLMCADKELKYWDTMLNKEYKKLYKSLPKEEKPRLKDAQRKWIKFRDAECIFAGYPMRGGSAEGILRLGCKVRLTKIRAIELKKTFRE